MSIYGLLSKEIEKSNKVDNNTVVWLVLIVPTGDGDY